VFAREVEVAEEAIDGFLAEGLEDGVLLEQVEALGLAVVVGEGTIGDAALWRLRVPHEEQERLWAAEWKAAVVGRPG
jgi:hypothetical protein